MRQQSSTAFLIALGILCLLFIWSLLARTTSYSSLLFIPLGIGLIEGSWMFVRWRFPVFYFSKLIAVFPKRVANYTHRGSVYFQKGQYELAVQDFDYVLSLNPTDAKNSSQRGWTCLHLKEYQRAIQDFDRSLELVPHSFRSYYGRGLAYYFLREWLPAIQDFDQALNCSPDRASQGTVFAVRGLTYHFRGEYRQALQDYHSALTCLPQHFITFRNCGLTHVLLKEYQLAIQACNTAIALSPRFGCAYDNRGQAYLGLDNLPQARADFEQGWELDPTHITHGWHVEWVRFCQEPPSQEVAKRLDKLVEIGTEHELMHIYIEHVCKGVAYWIRGRSGEALVEFDQSIQLEPIQWDAYFWKGLVCAAMGRDDEARTATQAALANSMPPILLSPLHWVNLALYQEFALEEESHV